MRKVLLVEWCSENNNTLIPFEWDKTKNAAIDFYSVSSKATLSVWWKCSSCQYEWKARIGNRTANGSGCPACSNRIVWKGHNDLATTHPELIVEWDDFKNGTIRPDNITAGSNKTAWWKCRVCNSSWKSSVYSRTRGSGCPICSGNKVSAGINDLGSSNPQLVEEWDYARNAPLLPSQVTVHSGKKVWWICHKCQQSWSAEIKSRTAGSNCPFCRGQKALLGTNDLQTLNPKLASEWHPTKNLPLLPTEVTTGSNKRIWWKCISGHEWQASIKSRNFGSGCPICARVITKHKIQLNRSIGNNNIATKYPDLMKEWCHSKNTVEPEKLTPFSGEKVWWQCAKCSYIWKAPVSSRTRGIGCPVCANKKVWKGHNDLATTHPDLAQEWDYSKNGNLLPSDYTSGSSVSVWWKCQKCGNEWKTAINNRKGKPCSKCHALLGTSEPEQCVFYYVQKIFKKAINHYRVDWLKPFSEIDIYIPEIKLAIEYDGQRWHWDKSKDLKKNKIIVEHGVDVIRLREEQCPVLEDNCQVIPVISGDDKSLTAAIETLFQYISEKYDVSCKVPIDLDNDRIAILSLYKRGLGAQSLNASGNSIVDEWNYERNGQLRPVDFTTKSSVKVWWKCSTCGYEYQTKISTRIQSKKGSCPFCQGKIVIEGKNDLATIRPELIKEWDFEKNDILPTSITAQSGKKVWWKCPICQKRWMAAVHDRGSSCNHKQSSR